MGVGALSFRIHKRNVVVKAASKWWGQWAAHIAAAWVLLIVGQLAASAKTHKCRNTFFRFGHWQWRQPAA